MRHIIHQNCSPRTTLVLWRKDKASFTDCQKHLAALHDIKSSIRQNLKRKYTEWLQPAEIFNTFAAVFIKITDNETDNHNFAACYL